MFDSQVHTIIEKRRKLAALRRARERVKRLERELSGESARPEPPAPVPEFLRHDAPLSIS
jgi:hypothetical protein